MFWVSTQKRPTMRLISIILLRWIQKSLNKNAKAFSNMVPEDGLEPSLLSETDFESVASTNFTTRAEWQRLYLCIYYTQEFSLTNFISD